MKKTFAILFFLSTIYFLHCAAQPAPAPLAAQINALLANFPARDPQQLNELTQAIGGLGEKGLEEMAVMLQPPGKGDNTSLEYALAGFSYCVTAPDKTDWRKWAVAAYISALGKLTAVENKAFLIRQLQTMGTDQAVPVLSSLLSDEQLSDPAARALVKINTAKSRQALLAALHASTGNNRLHLVEALGDSRCREAVSQLTPLAAGTDKILVKLALYALSRIADPASQHTMVAAAQQAGFGYDITGASGACFAYLTQLENDGHSMDADRIAALIFARTLQENQIPAKIAALTVLVHVRGEKSIPLLTGAMHSKNRVYRAAALKLALSFPGNTSVAAWVNTLPATAAPVRAEIITMLGETGNATALPAITKALQASDESEKAAAITALAKIGGPHAPADLLGVLKNAGSGEAAVVKQALLTLKTPGVSNILADALPTMPSATGKGVIIQVLMARGASDRFKDILPFLENGDTLLRRPAFEALKTMTPADQLPVLYRLLMQTTDKGDILSVQQAIVATSANGMDTLQRVRAINEQFAMAPAGKKQRYLPVLAGIGGPAALYAVSGAFTTGDEQVKTEAVQSLSAWPDISAAHALLQMARANGHTDYFLPAFTGYLHLVAAYAMPPEQKLLMLRDAMPIAQTPEQQKNILASAGKCKTWNALLFVGKYLDDPALQHQAAGLVVKLALADNSWTGATVRGLLEKSSALVNDIDSSYERQSIRKHLAALPAGEGFVPLFNGQNLAGWKGLVENPVARSKMPADTLAAKQKTADERMRKGWFVKDGELVFSGNGDNLCTEKKYGDFEMFVDWKITKDGDAGIYLRGSPQVQIWDTARVDVGAQVGSGGLYNNAVNPSKPLTLADNAIGEWNSFHILMKGDRVTVYLNGQLVVNNVMLENYWDRKQALFPFEQIELQAHGTYVAYRDLYIREMPSQKPFVLSDDEKKEGFSILFDGTNMHNWVGNTTEYILEDGNIVIYPQHGGHGNLYTKDEYSDFVYRFEFQLTPGANNGIGIRAPLEGDAAYVGMEIQVLDNEAPMYKNLHPYQYHGSVYGVIPAKRGFLKPVGEWNTEEITAKGTHITVVLNGTTILDGDIADAIKNGTMDGKNHPGLSRPTGHIGFLGHGDVVKFRNVRIRY